jgi:hypothetical protein
MTFRGIKTISFPELQSGLDSLGKDKISIQKSQVSKVAICVSSRDAQNILSEITDKFIEYELDIIDGQTIKVANYVIEIVPRNGPNKNLQKS